MLERVSGRTGCLFAGCCRGIPSELPWAQKFKGVVPLHPTQAYEFIAVLALFICSVKAYPNLKKHKGVTFFTVLASYALIRFLNEFLRSDTAYFGGLLRNACVATLSLLIVSLAGLIYAILRARDTERIIETLKKMLRVFLVSLAAGAVVVLSALTILRSLLS